MMTIHDSTWTPSKLRWLPTHTRSDTMHMSHTLAMPSITANHSQCCSPVSPHSLPTPPFASCRRPLFTGTTLLQPTLSVSGTSPPPPHTQPDTCPPRTNRVPHPKPRTATRIPPTTNTGNHCHPPSMRQSSPSGHISAPRPALFIWGVNPDYPSGPPSTHIHTRTHIRVPMT